MPYAAVARALEVIPRTLAQNCGADVVRVLTDLRAKHANLEDNDRKFYGIDGNTGKVENMSTIKVYDTLAVRKQTLKTAIESSCMLLRIDDIVSGIKKKEPGAGAPAPQPETPETFGDARDG